MATRTLLKPAGPVSFGGLEAARQASRARSREALDAAVSMAEWSLRAPEPQTGRIDFDRFPFQRAWYSDEVASAREVVWEKASQVGMSACSWRWGMRQADQFGDTVVYIFPTDTHVREFGDERIEPAIEASDYLRSRIQRQWVRHKNLKRIGRGWLHLRGSNSKAGAQSVAAQALVFDEYDLLDPVNLPQIERRIAGAAQIGKQPKVRRLGNPTIPDFGIDAAYQQSDRRVWHVRCEGCGFEQPIEWEANVRWSMPGHGDAVFRAGRDVEGLLDRKAVGRVWRACAACEHELDVAGGEWRVTNPGASTIGFHVSRLIVPYADLGAIVVASRGSSIGEVEAFENNDLGRSYSPAEASLTDADINAACSFGGPLVNGYAGPNYVTAGLDCASERNLNLRVSEQLPDGRRRALWIGEVPNFDDVVQLVNAFRVHTLVVDAQPERRLARALAATFPGRVHLCRYEDSMDAPMKFDPVDNIVKVHRTDAIDGMMDSIRQQRNIPLAQPPAVYREQLKALKRRTELDARGHPRKVYVKTGSQGDDFAHAEVYDMIATVMLRLKLSQQLSAGEQPIEDAELGVRRLRLTGSGLQDQYEPGFRRGR